MKIILFWLGQQILLVYTTEANQRETFAISETKLYVSAVTLSTQDNVKLLEQLKSGFKRIGINIYQNQDY